MSATAILTAGTANGPRRKLIRYHGDRPYTPPEPQSTLDHTMRGLAEAKRARRRARNRRQALRTESN